MKKVFLAFAVVSIFAACNDSSTDSTTTTDSTNLSVDTAAVTTPMMTDTSSNMMTDTSSNRMSADSLR